MNFSDIEALVQETLALNTQKGTSFRLDCLPESSGVIFKLEKKISTFVLRILAVENIKTSYQELKGCEELRLNSEESLESQVNYFSCDNLEIAKLIKENLGNKRFPLYEEDIFNISDYSDNWWLEVNPDKIKLHFKLSPSSSAGNLIKLGPLNNFSFAQDLKHLYGYFKLLFEVNEFSCREEGFTLKPVMSQDRNYLELKKLFMGEEVSDSFWTYLARLEETSLNKDYYQDLKLANYTLIKIFNLRHFCKLIESELRQVPLQ